MFYVSSYQKIFYNINNSEKDNFPAFSYTSVPIYSAWAVHMSWIHKENVPRGQSLSGGPTLVLAIRQHELSTTLYEWDCCCCRLESCWGNIKKTKNVPFFSFNAMYNKNMMMEHIKRNFQKQLTKMKNKIFLVYSRRTRKNVLEEFEFFEKNK